VNIINRITYGKESFVLTRRGETLAAIVSLEDLKLLQEIEEQMDIEDAWKSRNEPGESISIVLTLALNRAGFSEGSSPHGFLSRFGTLSNGLHTHCRVHMPS